MAIIANPHAAGKQLSKCSLSAIDYLCFLPSFFVEIVRDQPPIRAVAVVHGAVGKSLLNLTAVKRLC